MEIKETRNIGKLSIISEFASKILKNSKQLEPQIVEMVNKEFWNLI